jgi:hypothetical protein
LTNGQDAAGSRAFVITASLCPDVHSHILSRSSAIKGRPYNQADLMRRFKWIEWNLRKIGDHGLSAEEVEAAFDRVLSLRERRDGSFQMFAATPSGRRVWVIWRYDREDDEVPDVFSEVGDVPIFVITAY